MIEKDFKDRIPKHPGRIRLVPVEGQQNTFDLTKADEPTEEGTALNREAFNSIIQSRLTGRYYITTAQKQTIGTRENLTTDPIPKSWLTVDNLTSYSNGWTVTVSSNRDYAPHSAFDGNISSYWLSNKGVEHTLTIDAGEPIKVSKFNIDAQQLGAQIERFIIKGSNTGNSWDTLRSLTSISANPTLTTIGEYRYYQFVFTLSDNEGQMQVRELKISEYAIVEYNLGYIADDMPIQWDVNQRVLITTPDTYTERGVVSNTFNGILINTILQPSRKYELVYNGSSFVAKEV